MPKLKKGTKISDLAGSWKMTDEEAEEIMSSFNKPWRIPESTDCSKKAAKSK